MKAGLWRPLRQTSAHQTERSIFWTVLRPALLYGTECWAINKNHEHSMQVAEMRMLQNMTGAGPPKRAGLVTIASGKAWGVTDIENKMTEHPTAMVCPYDEAG